MGMRPFILALAFLAAGVIPASAEKRVALVIGNSAYQNVVPLTNPANDATAITATLKSAGFDVVDSRRDLKASEMKRALRDFSDKARDADVALVYYAGHGIEIDGTVIAPAASDNEAFVQKAYELAERVGTKPVWDSFFASSV